MNLEISDGMIEKKEKNNCSKKEIISSEKDKVNVEDVELNEEH